MTGHQLTMVWSVSSSLARESGPSSVSPSFGTDHILGLPETGCECSVSLLPHTERRPHPIWRCGSSLTCCPSLFESVITRLCCYFDIESALGACQFRTMRMPHRMRWFGVRGQPQFPQISGEKLRKYRGMICITPLRSEHTELSHH
jgi:hypothetical protein